MKLNDKQQHKLRFAAKRGARFLDLVRPGQWFRGLDPETLTVKDIDAYVQSRDNGYSVLTAEAIAAGFRIPNEHLLGGGVFGIKPEVWGYFIGIYPHTELENLDWEGSREVLTRAWRRLVAERQREETKKLKPREIPRGVTRHAVQRVSGCGTY